MDKKKVLLVTQEMKPYLLMSSIAEIARQLPQYLQEQGMEIRILMPRFGNINERRHRLHEVVRLSGINIIIAEDDFPLMIKVASLPGTRLQVYFLDNEDFFRRKHVFADGDDNFYEDNAERMIFFCKGVLETVRKFGWSPDLVHCHGWMTSLLPAYLKTAYKKDPLFSETKVIYSLYENAFDTVMGDSFSEKAVIKRVAPEDLEPFGQASNTDLHLGAMHYADSIIKGDENIDPRIIERLSTIDKPVLDFQSQEDFLPAYCDFYGGLLGAEEKA